MFKEPFEAIFSILNAKVGAIIRLPGITAGVIKFQEAKSISKVKSLMFLNETNVVKCYMQNVTQIIMLSRRDELDFDYESSCYNTKLCGIANKYFKINEQDKEKDFLLDDKIQEACGQIESLLREYKQEVKFKEETGQVIEDFTKEISNKIDEVEQSCRSFRNRILTDVKNIYSNIFKKIKQSDEDIGDVNEKNMSYLKQV